MGRLRLEGPELVWEEDRDFFSHLDVKGSLELAVKHLKLRHLSVSPHSSRFLDQGSRWSVGRLTVVPGHTSPLKGIWSVADALVQGTLENQGTFESTNSLRLEAGGIFRNGGTADVKGLSGNGTVEAKASGKLTVHDGPFQGGIRWIGKALATFYLKAMTIDPTRLPSWMKTGKWIIDRLLLETPGSPKEITWTSDTPLQVGTLLWNGAGILKLALNLTCDTLSAPNGTVFVMEPLKINTGAHIKSLCSFDLLSGSGIWDVDNFQISHVPQGNTLALDVGSLVLKSENVHLRGQICQRDQAGHFKIQSSGNLVCEEAGGFLAHIQAAGRLELQAAKRLDTRDATLRGGTGVTLMSSGEILVADSVPGTAEDNKRLESLILEGYLPGDRTPLSDTAPYILSAARERGYPGARVPNGAGITSLGPLTLNAPHIDLSFGFLRALGPVSFTSTGAMTVTSSRLWAREHVSVTAPDLWLRRAPIPGYQTTWMGCKFKSFAGGVRRVLVTKWDEDVGYSETISAFPEVSGPTVWNVGGLLDLSAPGVCVDGSTLLAGSLRWSGDPLALPLTEIAGDHSNQLARPSLVPAKAPRIPGPGLIVQPSLPGNPGALLVAGRADLAGRGLSVTGAFQAESLNLIGGELYAGLSYLQTPTKACSDSLTINLVEWVRATWGKRGHYLLQNSRGQVSQYSADLFCGPTQEDEICAFEPWVLEASVRESAAPFLGREALLPRFMAEILDVGKQIARASQGPAAQGSALIQASDTPSHLVWRKAGAGEQPGLWSPHLFLNPRSHKTLIQPRSGFIYTEDQLACRLSGGLTLRGGVLVNDGTGPYAINLKATHIDWEAFKRWVSYKQYIRWWTKDVREQRIVQDSGVCARRGGLVSMTVKDTKITGVPVWGETNVGFWSQEGRLHLGAELLKRTTTSTHSYDEGGLFGRTVTVHEKETSSQARQALVGSHGPIVYASPVIQSGLQSVGSSVHFAAGSNTKTLLEERTYTKTTEKDSPFYSSISTRVETQLRPVPNRVVATTGAITLGGETFTGQAHLKAPHIINEAKHLDLRPSTGKREICEAESRSSALVSRAHKQALGEDVIVPSTIETDLWQQTQRDGVERLSGVSGQIKQGVYAGRAEWVDAQKRHWAVCEANRSGLLRGSCAPPALDRAFKSLGEKHAPMVQAGAVLQVAATTLSTAVSGVQATQKLASGEPLAAGLILVAPWTTFSLGSESMRQSQGITKPVPTTVHRERYQIGTKAHPVPKVTMQGIQQDGQGIVWTHTFQGLASTTKTLSEFAHESTTFGMCPLTGTLSIGNTWGRGRGQGESHAPGGNQSTSLELHAQEATLKGYSLTPGTLTGDVQTLALVSLQDTSTATSKSGGFSLSVPVAAWVGIPTPLSLAHSSAGAAASTALSSTQAALSVAKSVSGQREAVDSKQAKTKAPVRVAPQDPGKGQLHIGTLTTTGDADVHPSIPVRTHVHHHQPDTDTTTRSGFSLPIGPVFDIHTSLQTLGGLLSPSSSETTGTALDLEALDALELSQKAEIRKTLIANGASPEVADRVLNSPEMHTILKETQQFDRDTRPQGGNAETEAYAAQRRTAQIESHAAAQRGEAPTIAIGYEPSLQERAIDVIRTGALALDRFASRHEDLAPWIVTASQLILQGPLKCAQGLTADFACGETAATWIQKSLQSGTKALNQMGLIHGTGDPAHLELAANTLGFAASYVIAGPKGVMSAAKQVKVAFHKVWGPGAGSQLPASASHTKMTGGGEGPLVPVEKPLVGPYKEVRGHHVHAKKAFEGHMNYDPNKGFSMSEKLMDSLKLKHSKITGTQQKLYRELAESGRPNTMQEHTRIAVESLTTHGVSSETARSLVAQSLESLRQAGVRTPTTIPWGKQ